MSHWITFPILMPAMMAAIIVFIARYHPVVARSLSVASCLAILAVAIGLAFRTGQGEIIVYALGDWTPPFGIVLVADRLATYMVLLTSLLALPVLLHAIATGWDVRGRHFHALYQFQLMGIMGAFLTGDMFNLFVFFEVLLIASYGLMIHSGGTARTKAGTQYVLYNLLGSTLFLFALGTLYAETGSLNMADLAQRVQAIGPDATSTIRVAAVLLLLVFAVKAALTPLQFWLPSSYAEAPAPVAALFAIMTKVGAYSIIRVFTVIFAPGMERTEGLHGFWLLPVALISLTIGMIGVMGARRLDRLVAFSVIGSMGMMFAALATFTVPGVTAALYYIAHSTFATALLFLTVDMVTRNRTAALEQRLPVPAHAMVAGFFFVGAIAMTGMPPLSGYLGKLLVLDATRDTALFSWAWAVILSSSLIAIIGFARAGSTVFWKASASPAADDTPPGDPPAPMAFAAIGVFVFLIVLQTALAGPITRYLAAVSGDLTDPEPYISAVLSTEGKEIPSGDDEDEEAAEAASDIDGEAD